MNDLISRQAAIAALDKRFDNIPMEQTAEILMLRKDLRELPSVQPEPKKGEWSDGYRWQRCSLCKQTGKKSWNYCPNCGADMRGGQDDSF